MKTYTRFLILFTLLGFFSPNLHAQTETKLPVSFLGTGGGYGNDVCIGQNYLIVGGGPGILFPVTPTTHASVFEQKNGKWESSARLTPSDSADAGEGFGNPVCLTEGIRTYAFVGASDDTDPNLQAGAVYVFERAGSGPWVEAAKVRAGDPQNKSALGRSIAADGEYMITGAPLFDVDPTGDPNGGKAYIFKRESVTGSWIQDTALVAPDSRANAHFGISVSMSMPYAIVGANMGDSLGPTQYGGTAYIFELKTNGWEFVQKLVPSIRSGAPQFGDLFGNSVGLDGDRAVIGAYGFVTGSSIHGATFVFEKTAMGWEEKAILTPSDAQSSGDFGIDVALHGDGIAVGASGTSDVGGFSANGSVYIYKLTGGSWIEQSPKIVSSDALDGGLFGRAVDIWGDGAVVGDPSANFNMVPLTGMAYFYEGICTQGVGIESLFSSTKDAQFVYPNPVTQQFSVQQGPENEPFSTLTILDMQGRKVLSNSLTPLQTQIDVSHLPAGIYVISQTFASGMSRQQRILKHF